MYEGYGLIRIFTEKIRISPTKLWGVCVTLCLSMSEYSAEKGFDHIWSEERHTNVLVLTSAPIILQIDHAITAPQDWPLSPNAKRLFTLTLFCELTNGLKTARQENTL